MIFMIIYAVLGGFSIFSGIRIIVTGKLAGNEEKKLADFTEKSARTYKLVYSIFYIVIGLLFFGLGTVNLLESMHILEDTLPYTIGFIVAVLAIIGVLGLTWYKCKKESEKDEEE